MADSKVESTPYGTFERLLYIFLIPLIFVAILLAVLLSLFDYDVMNSALKVANQVPLLEKFVPDPDLKGKVKQTAESASQGKDMPDSATKVSELNAQLAQSSADLKQAAAANEQKEQTIKELKTQLGSMEEKLKVKTQSEDEYRMQIQQLASMYAKMMPSKAAPILQNLTLSEISLVLSEMKPDDRVKILEKMAPKKAAEASVHIKDMVSVKDKQIAALQERLNIYAAADPTSSSTLSKDELGLTFANMPPKSAAAILIQISAVSQPRVILILRSMDNQARANVLAAISDTSKETAANLAGKLSE